MPALDVANASSNAPSIENCDISPPMRVFGVSELMSLVLDELDEADLFRTRRVSRVFNEHVLYMKQKWLRKHNQQRLDENPTSTTKFNPFFCQELCGSLRPWCTVSAYTPESSSKYPGFRLRPEFEATRDNDVLLWDESIDEPFFDRVLCGSDMVISIPPITSITITVDVHQQASDYCKWTGDTICDDKGLTLGHVVDEIITKLESIWRDDVENGFNRAALESGQFEVMEDGSAWFRLFMEWPIGEIIHETMLPRTGHERVRRRR